MPNTDYADGYQAALYDLLQTIQSGGVTEALAWIVGNATVAEVRGRAKEAAAAATRGPDTYFVSYAHRFGYGMAAVETEAPVRTFDDLTRIAQRMEESNPARGQVTILNYIPLPGENATT